ncbi:hypothetical protein PIB30_022592 [Stylosanthes scabra]|uniref:Uncharacterized protein n=1 Tax=Stylosanthes scabra TaxID=79078 RepID=A0ABU6Q9X2_9FABA|nr:hypothetical protein [Stylosanthes scabra]
MEGLTPSLVVVDVCGFLELHTGETLKKKILNDKLVATIKAKYLVCESSLANHMSNVYLNVFEEMCEDINVVDEEEIDIPPGFEENSQTIFPPPNLKFGPLKIVECNPKITKFVATALC